MDGVDAIYYIIENNIEGAVVECGVDSGNFEHLWINQLMCMNALRHIYLFDTFGGLVAPSEYDYTCPDSTIYQMNKDEVYNMWKTHIIDEKTNRWCYTPLEQVQQRLNSTGYPQEYLHYVVGDVLETLQHKSNIPEKIAILRLDTDWYESSKYELEQMYERVVPGESLFSTIIITGTGNAEPPTSFSRVEIFNMNLSISATGKPPRLSKNNRVSFDIIGYWNHIMC